MSRVWLGEGSPAPVEVYGYHGALLVRDRASKIWLDPRDGAPIDIQRNSDLNALERWIDTADPVHFGNFAGILTKMIWFLFGLALSALTLTGAYLQVKRQQWKHLRGTVRAPLLGAYRNER